MRHTFQTTSHSHLPSFLCLQQTSIHQNHIYTSNSPWTTTNPIITMATSNTTMQVRSILPHNQALTCSKPQLIYLHAGTSFSSTPATRFQPSALAPGKASPVKSAIRCQSCLKGMVKTHQHGACLRWPKRRGRWRYRCCWCGGCSSKLTCFSFSITIYLLRPVCVHRNSFYHVMFYPQHKPCGT